jgi:hypothetical protein
VLTGFGAFLRTSLAILESEVPAQRRAMAEHLAGRVLAIAVDGDIVDLAFDGTVLGVPVRRVELTSTRAAILAVVDGDRTLADALLDGSLFLRGALDDVLACHDALMAYLHGAVRAPSFPLLLRRFRRGEPLDDCLETSR